METKAQASLKTFVKYLFWTAVAAGISAAAESLAKLELPAWAVPIIAATLKGAATWVATEKEKYPYGLQ